MRPEVQKSRAQIPHFMQRIARVHREGDDRARAFRDPAPGAARRVNTSSAARERSTKPDGHSPLLDRVDLVPLELQQVLHDVEPAAPAEPVPARVAWGRRGQGGGGEEPWDPERRERGPREGRARRGGRRRAGWLLIPSHGTPIRRGGNGRYVCKGGKSGPASRQTRQTLSSAAPARPD